MRWSHPRILAPIVILLGASLHFPRHASAAPPAPEAARPDIAREPPMERITSEMVLIEVYVTGPRGDPIEGLGPGDFVLMVDGRPASIATVEFLRTAAAPGDSPASPAAIRAGNGTLVSSLSRRLVFFLDEATSYPGGMTQARRAVADFITGSLAPADEIALIAFDGTLRVLHPFTTDREDLKRALEAETARAGNQPPLLDRRRLAVDLSAAISAGDLRPQDWLPRAARIVNRYTLQVAEALRALLGDLRSLADSLAAWPGYKAIVFVGDGIPEDTAEGYFEKLGGNPTGAAMWTQSEQAAQKIYDQVLRRSLATDQAHDLSGEVRNLLEAMAADRVTLDTIETAGGLAGHETNELASVTRKTGGVSASTRDLQAALRLVDTTSRGFYTLGYIPQGPPDNLWHVVDVRVRRSAANLSWRRGFVRRDPAAARDASIQAAMHYPALHAGPRLDLSVVSGPSDESERVVDVTLHLPARAILFLPEAGRRVARLTIGIIGADASGVETARVTRDVTVALPDHLPDGWLPGLDVSARIRIPNRDQTITSVALDRTTGIPAAARLEIAAVPWSERKVVGLTIRSLAEESLWVEIPETDLGQPAPYVIAPALKAEFTVAEPIECGFEIPGLSAAGASAAGVSAAGVSAPGVLAEGAIPFRVAIRDQRGGTLRAENVTTSQRRPSGGFALRLPADGLPPGDYMVLVQELTGAGPVDRAALPLRLKAAADARPAPAPLTP